VSDFILKVYGALGHHFAVLLVIIVAVGCFAIGALLLLAAMGTGPSIPCVPPPPPRKKRFG
jgi:hypothetical protein